LLKLDWKNSTITFSAADEVKTTVFDWLGPLNVPGYSIYNYKASGALGSSKWASPNSGTIKSGSGTSDVDILWDGGPVVGKAVYEVNNNYVWDLEVNVVEVDVTTGAGTYPPGKAPKETVDTTSELVIIQAPGDATFETMATVNGPAGGRGIKFIEVGYIQNVHVDAKNGSYPGDRRLTSSIEGNDYVDPAPTSNSPWSDTSLDRAFWDPSDSDHGHSHDCDHGDGPSFGLQTTLDGNADGPKLLEGRIEEAFHRYLAVHTKQSVNSSEDVYTQRAAIH
jgi:hypothetical protein